MKLPVQSMPIIRSVSSTGVRAEVTSSSCVGCYLKGAALIAGPCDPLGLPEDLPICIPAAAAYVASCADCLGGTVKSAVCGAVHLAEKAGIPIPSSLKAVCG